jgi:drug/metabolite transporter (DMT)-like permease
LGFGGFFIFITLAGPRLALTPLIISRSTFFVITCLLLLVKRAPLGTAMRNPYIWLTGAFDAGGNALYMLAKEFTRIDIAVVLSSLYPGITVLLSRVFLKERISRPQWLGVVISVSAVILITL